MSDLDSAIKKICTATPDKMWEVAMTLTKKVQRMSECEVVDLWKKIHEFCERTMKTDPGPGIRHLLGVVWTRMQYLQVQAHVVHGKTTPLIDAVLLKYDLAAKMN